MIGRRVMSSFKLKVNHVIGQLIFYVEITLYKLGNFDKNGCSYRSNRHSIRLLKMDKSAHGYTDNI